MKDELPPGFSEGPFQTRGVIGDITEAIHRFVLDGWDNPGEAPPRIEEDLSFVPKDREQVLYVYMYRAIENTALKNPKRFVQTPFSFPNPEDPAKSIVYYEWPPLHLEVFYLVMAHAKFRSEAERLLGWTMMRLHQATDLIYRPVRYLLPDGREFDSNGKPWMPDSVEDGIVYEKVSLALVDDLTIGDAINFFTIHEAPFRPFLTYKAQCNMRGSVVQAQPTIVRVLQPEATEQEAPAERANGRVGRIPMRSQEKTTPFGPPGHGIRPMKGNNDSEG